VAESQGKKEESKDAADAADAAGLLEKLSVGDSKTEEKEKQAKELSQTVADKAKEDGEKEDEPASST
jgi:Ran-binding protein 1